MRLICCADFAVQVANCSGDVVSIPAERLSVSAQDDALTTFKMSFEAMNHTPYSLPPVICNWARVDCFLNTIL